MTCDFTSFSTVFKSYQDDGWMIMKTMCNGTPFTIEKDPCRKRDSNLGTSISAGQRLTY